MRYEPAAAAVPAASSPAPETVPPPLIAAVLLVNSTRCRLLHKSPSTQVTLQGLSLFIAEAEGAFPEGRPIANRLDAPEGVSKQPCLIDRQLTRVEEFDWPPRSLSMSRCKIQGKPLNFRPDIVPKL